MKILSKIIALLIFSGLLPFFAIISFLIFIEDGRPIFFTQKRYGQNNKFFKIFKFRTMKNGTPDIPTHLLKKNFSITPLGKFLRKFSLDELPQLINIIKGDMVFIGPRPALHNQDDLMNLRRSYKIDSMKPGVTGLAQIYGRDDNSIEKKIELERIYLQKKSIILDSKIILMTIFQLIIPRNISH